jgi:hypothetical protein
MATDPSVGDFNPDDVRAGLRLAMMIGLPVDSGDQPTFYMPMDVTDDGAHNLDQNGTPFNSSYRPVRSVPTTKRVPCGVEYQDAEGILESWGSTTPSKAVLTLLDLDYRAIRGFSYVVIGGVKYEYRSTETPKGLVSVGIYKVHVASDDQG